MAREHEECVLTWEKKVFRELTFGSRIGAPEPLCSRVAALVLAVSARGGARAEDGRRTTGAGAAASVMAVFPTQSVHMGLLGQGVTVWVVVPSGERFGRSVV
ncbi:hypothetical protein GCM10023317_27510 [Actinopolymorpha pittospori]